MSTTFLEIGRRLREVRASTGLSQAEFAEFLGTSYRSYRAYETGQREITTAVVLKVEAIQGVARGWLLSGDNLELEDKELAIVQETLERGLTELKSTNSVIDPISWAQKLRLAIKLGLSQNRSLPASDIAEIVGSHQGQQRTTADDDK